MNININAVLIIIMYPAVPPVLSGVSEVGDPFLPRSAHVPPHARRAILHGIRADVAGFYISAAYLAGQNLPLFETLTGDHTGSCPLPSHPPGGTRASRALSLQERHTRVARALRAAQASPLPAAPPVQGRPLRIHHGQSGGGWRCSTCGSGSAIQFLSRLFFLPATNGDAAAWNLAARILRIDPAAVDARAWLPWDADTAHFEWGKAVAYTRSQMDRLRPLYQARFPSWRDTDILQFPATGRGTCLAAYRVRGRLTQLEEVELLSPDESAPAQRRVRYHHWSSDRPTSLARSVTGVFPDTLASPAEGRPLDGGFRAASVAHIVQGAEEAASARSLLGPAVIGTAYGPLGLGQADVDALARYDRVHVWAAQTPAGRGFQNQVVRLLRACGIAARPVRWSDWARVPRGYSFTRFVRDQGTVETGPDASLRLHLPDHSYDQMSLELGEAS